MSATQVVKVPSGGTLAVREGILRGAGPQGPMGPQGPAGQQGITGLQGPPGEVNQLKTQLSSSSAVATSFDHWYPMTLDTQVNNDLLVSTDGLNLQFTQAMDVLMVVIARFDTTHAPSDGGTAGGSRQLRFVDAGANVVNNSEVHVEAASNEPTFMMLFNVITVDPSKFYHLEGLSRDDIGVTCSSRWATFYQIGAGPQGPQGPVGPVGSTGPQGATGATGSAGSGYASFNVVATGSPDTTLAPSGVTYITSADQGLRTPTGTDLPSTPYFLSRLAKDIEPLLVSRYASSTDRSTKRPTRVFGEITTLNSTGAPYFREQSGNDNAIARVVTSSSAPPSGSGQAAPGVIWFQTS